MNAPFSEVAASIVEDRLLVSGGGLGDRLLKYEVRDRQTDSVLDDGEGVDLAIALPEDDGDFAVLVSPATKPSGSLLFFRVVVDAGVARLASRQVASAASLRRSRQVQRLARGVAQPFRSIWRNRSLMI